MLTKIFLRANKFHIHITLLSTKKSEKMRIFATYLRIYFLIMSCILNIETSTDVCSVAISDSGQVIFNKEDHSGPNHAVLPPEVVPFPIGCSPLFFGRVSAGVWLTSSRTWQGICGWDA